MKITKEMADKAMGHYAYRNGAEWPEVKEVVEALGESEELIKMLRSEGWDGEDNPMLIKLVAFSYGILVGLRIAETEQLERLVKRG